MNKQALFDKEIIFSVLIKLVFLALGYFYILFELSTVDEISKETYSLYRLIMLVCLISFGLTVYHKIRKIAYIVCSISCLAFIYMYKYNAEIVNQHNETNCLEVGKIYDPIQKICRDDCWKWDDKLGCLKE